MTQQEWKIIRAMVEAGGALEEDDIFAAVTVDQYVSRSCFENTLLHLESLYIIESTADDGWRLNLKMPLDTAPAKYKES